MNFPRAPHSNITVLYLLIYQPHTGLPCLPSCGNHKKALLLLSVLRLPLVGPAAEWLSMAAGFSLGNCECNKTETLFLSLICVYPHSTSLKVILIQNWIRNSWTYFFITLFLEMSICKRTSKIFDVKLT
jgi:hypothetical protein